MGLALIQKGSFQTQQVVLVIMLLFLLWIQVVLFMFPIELTTLVLRKSLTQINNTTIYTTIYSINFSTTKKRFSLSLHYNGDNSYLFFNGRNN